MLEIDWFQKIYLCLFFKHDTHIWSQWRSKIDSENSRTLQEIRNDPYISD